MAARFRYSCRNGRCDGQLSRRHHRPGRRAVDRRFVARIAVYTPAFAPARALETSPHSFSITGGTSMAVVAESILAESLLNRCRERAPEYDRNNRFFQEDFDELKSAGYLRMALPKQFGGQGMNVAEEIGRASCRERV